MKHYEDVGAAWVVMNGMTDHGVFKAKKSQSKKGARRGQDVRGAPTTSGKRRTPGQPRTVPASRAIRPAESALVGEEFEEEGIDWRVLSVVWSADQNQVMVWYYDVQAANVEGLTKEQMEAACAESQDLDPLECSTIAEVSSWIALSSRADS